MYAEQTQEEVVFNLLKGVQFDRERHGSLFDRGSADSHYWRQPQPHWYPNGTGNGPRIEELTAEEIAEYTAGYEWNERFGDKKDWE